MAGLQVIIFDVCGTACAIRRQEVRELLPVPRLWRPPGTPRPVAGFFNLSGTAVPVVRLDIVFGLPKAEDSPEAALYSHLMLIEDLSGSGLGALLVDRVQDVTDVAETAISPVDQTDTLNGCVEAEIGHDGRLIHLLSRERILLAEERQALADLGASAQKRLQEWAVPA